MSRFFSTFCYDKQFYNEFVCVCVCVCVCVTFVQSLSHIQLFGTPGTAALQAYLSFTISQSLLILIPLESVRLSNHVICGCPLLLLLQSSPTSGCFPMSWLFTSDGQSFGASVSAMNTQGWFPLRLTGFIFLQFKGHSGIFTSITI